MKTCIQNSFAADGCFTTIRSDDMQLSAQLDATQFVDNTVAIAEGVEIDENVEELALISDAESGDESD